MSRISNLRSAGLRTLAAAVILASSGCLSIDSPLGGAALVVIVSGNEQTVAPNATTPDPLVVRVFDNAAAPLGGVSVTWTVNSGGGAVSQQTTTTDGAGLTSVNYTAGTATGTSQVRATAEGLTVTFTVSIVAAAG
jgi:hypothetical protein